MPTNFPSLTNESILPDLICPADHSRHPATNWASFSAANCSYELVTPGLRQGEPNGVCLRCKIHGYKGYADGRLLHASGRLLMPYKSLRLEQDAGFLVATFGGLFICAALFDWDWAMDYYNSPIGQLLSVRPLFATPSRRASRILATAIGIIFVVFGLSLVLVFSS